MQFQPPSGATDDGCPELPTPIADYQPSLRFPWLAAEEKLKAEIARGGHRKKVVTPSRRREMAQKSISESKANIRVSCAIFSISETCYRYQAKLSTENAEIADWLLRLSITHKRWGFGVCYLYLRNIKVFGLSIVYTLTLQLWN